MDAPGEIAALGRALRGGEETRKHRAVHNAERIDGGGPNAGNGIHAVVQGLAKRRVVANHGLGEFEWHLGHQHMAGVEAEILVAQVPQ